MAEVRVHFDVNAELQALEPEFLWIAETGARILRDEIEPPRSSGRYRDAWRSTRAVRVGNRVVALTVNDITTEQGTPLAWILEHGHGPAAPHPHIRPAEVRAGRQIDAMLSSVGPGR